MRILSLHLASKSDALVKLHVNNDSDGVVDIPVKNLIKISSGEESFTSTASYSNLHHCGLSAMSKYAPEKHIPSYVSENRELVTYYKNEGGVTKFSSDCELTAIIADAIADNLMDDNDGVILHIFCKYHYHSHFSFDEATNIRAAATTAADNVMRQMKIWVTNAHQSLEKKRNSASKVYKDYGPEYDVIADVNVDKDKSKPLEWANRFAQFFLVSEDDIMSENECLKKSKRLINSTEKNIDILLQGVMRTSELVSTGTMTAAEFISSVIARHNESSKEANTVSVIHSPTPRQDDHNMCRRKSMSTQEDEDEKGVEIIFNSENKNTPSEWKIFFDLHSFESNSICSLEDKKSLDSSASVPNCSSQSSISSFLALSDVISDVNSDDISWIPDDSQSSLLSDDNSTESGKSLISAFSIVGSDDESWDVLGDDE